MKQQITTSNNPEISGRNEFELPRFANYDGSISEAPYEVYVDGKETELFAARVSKMPFNRHWPGHQRSWDQTELAAFASFTVDKPVEIRLVANKDFKEAVVRPVSKKITPEVCGREIKFIIEKPCQIVVEINGRHDVLYLFANPPEENVPSPDDKNVLYFGAGEHDVGRIIPKNGQIIYIAEGAVVYGEIYAMDVENVTVRGRGILDHSKILPEEIPDDAQSPDPLRPSPILFNYCKNITIEGIIVRDPCFLAVRPVACENVIIDNIKIIGCWRYNSDGIDFINSKHCRVRNCFVRSFDDSHCLKGFYFLYQGEMFHNRKAYDTMEDVEFDNCVVWNDWGKALEIGVDLCAREIKNCAFRNCDILHVTAVAIDVSNVDYADVHDILFENIRVEYDKINQMPTIQEKDEDQYIFDANPEYLPELLCLNVCYSVYSHGGTVRGKESNITMRNIDVYAPKMPPSFFSGYDEEHGICGVRIENLTLNGKKLTSFDEANIEIRDYATDIEII